MNQQLPPFGSIVWIDQASADGDRVREFYTAVVGWTHTAVDMGGYSDYSMFPPGASQPVAGVCHARGVNADIPVGWLVYIIVKDLDASLAACTKLGGQIVVPPKGMGGKARYAIIKDPGGAVAALYCAGE